MFNSLVFPYGITLREDGVIETVPVAEVGLKDKRGEWLSLFLIIDSGATISALPKGDALTLGIDVEKGETQVISGIGGEILSGWQHHIKVRLKNIKVDLPVIFLDQEIAPRVLGRAGIFERFILVFEEKRKRVGFIKKGVTEAGVIQKILDKIQKEK